jgi:predicted dehydrogenase
MLRIALVGCGAVAEMAYLPALMRRQDSKLTVVADPAEQRSALLARLTGAKKTADVMTETDLFDAAILALPHYLHGPASISLLAAGKHVLVEKPMALSLSECNQMIRAEKKSGATLAIGHMRRFVPAIRLAREFIANRNIGRVLKVQIREGSIYGWPAVSDSFFQKKKAGGGVLFDLGSHILDTASWLFGPLAPVECNHDGMGGVEADCQALLRSSEGFEIDVSMSRIRDLGASWKIEGDRGWIEFSPVNSKISFQLENGFTHRGQIGLLRSCDTSIYEQLFDQQIESWIDSIRQAQPTFCTSEDGRRVISLIEELYRMANASLPCWESVPELGPSWRG